MIDSEEHRCLPPSEVSETKARSTSEYSGERAGRILVVDDVSFNREILRRWLTRRGFEVVEACDGAEALDVVARDSVDLILLDVMMPKLNGVEVVRAIRSSGSRADLPIVMVSAKSLSEDISECMEAGANDYITKPVDFALMLAHVRKHLES